MASKFQVKIKDGASGADVMEFNSVVASGVKVLLDGLSVGQIAQVAPLAKPGDAPLLDKMKEGAK